MLSLQRSCQCGAFHTCPTAAGKVWGGALTTELVCVLTAPGD